MVHGPEHARRMEPPLDVFLSLSETVVTLPDHRAAPPVTEGPQPYELRTDPDVLANGLDLDSTRRWARLAPDLQLPKSLKDTAKRAIRALMPPGQARKPKDGNSAPRPSRT